MDSRQDQKIEIQQATDIVELIGRDIALKPKGREFVGLCPFHEDHRPSMSVAPSKQIFHCFACGSGGDVFGWMMKYHKMSFIEALRALADQAGITLINDHAANNRTSAPEGPSDRDLIKQANTQAIEFFQAILHHKEHGCASRQYLQTRGIGNDMVDSFQLGYAPDRWDGLTKMIADKGWSNRSFELAGLLSHRRNRPGYLDRFRHRLIFPICDSIGRPIAFGGRFLPEGTLNDPSEAKYLNTAETPLFNKSATLYGLHLAKPSIISTQTAIIVEGYTDVIAAHQAGIRNVVATLGTALTNQHVHELRRYAVKAILVFDADEAGQKAADRAVEVFFAGSLDVDIAILPKGQDPATLLSGENGVLDWNHAIDHAVDAMSYQLDRVQYQLESTGSLTGKQNLAEAYLQKLASLGLSQTSLLRRSLIIQRLAELLHMSETDLSDLLQKLTPTGRSRPSTTALNGTKQKNIENNSTLDVVQQKLMYKMTSLHQAERQLIGSILRQPQLAQHKFADGRTLEQTISPMQMVTDHGRRLYEWIERQLSSDGQLSLANLLSELASQNEQELADLATLAETEIDQRLRIQNDRVEMFLVDAAESLLRHHREQAYQQKRTTLLDHAEKSQNQEKTQRLQQQIGEHLKQNPSPIRIARVRRSS